MLDHISIQCDDYPASLAFYDAVLAPLGGKRILDFGTFCGYGTETRPVFCISIHATGGANRESHIAFTATDRSTVPRSSTPRSRPAPRCCTTPRVWPEYHPNYYGAFVRDPDGNNVEAVCHSPE